MYVCDTCRREYRSYKTLRRHVKERHTDNEHYPCIVPLCKAKFIRRGYLTTHLRKIHNFERSSAKTLAKSVKRVKEISSNEYTSSFGLEDVSEDELPNQSDNEKCTEKDDQCHSFPGRQIEDETQSLNFYQPEVEDISDTETGCLFNLIDEYMENCSSLTANDDDEFIHNLLFGAGDGNSGNSDVTHHINEDLKQNSDNESAEQMLNVISEERNDKAEKQCDQDELYFSDSCDECIDEGITATSSTEDNEPGENYEESLFNAVLQDKDAEGEELSNHDQPAACNQSQPTTNDRQERESEDNDGSDCVVIGSDDDSGDEEICFSTIHLTLSKTERIRNGNVVSVSRSAAIGHSSNLSFQDIRDNLNNIFQYVHDEFTEYANYYQNN